MAGQPSCDAHHDCWSHEHVRPVHPASGRGAPDRLRQARSPRPRGRTQIRPALPRQTLSSRERIHAAKASTEFTTDSNRGEWNRSNPCCPPGSSAYTTGLGDLRCSRSANRRAISTGTTVSRSPWINRNGGAETMNDYQTASGGHPPTLLLAIVRNGDPLRRPRARRSSTSSKNPRRTRRTRLLLTVGTPRRSG